MAIHHVLALTDVSRPEIDALFELTSLLKQRKVKVSAPLAGKTLGLMFQKPSVRTRLSFEVGMYQLGGQCAYLGPEDIQQGHRESAKDLARVLSRYVNGIAARTFAHQDVVELARWSTVPVINGLSDTHHPCQALADLYTILGHFGSLKSLKIAYLGDGNNVCHSLMHGCALLGAHLTVATPKPFPPQPGIVEEARRAAARAGGALTLTHDPNAAASGAAVLYTDVWVSMGQARTPAQLKAFAPFQLNRALVARADKRHIVMHCLPAHRGEEITDEVMDSPHSMVYDQAENRLHVQKAILLWLLRGAKSR
ncbi:MAG: ornithine carbamoyltransferase [Candidatus Omnitrophica bacterium]|nr:ornithine carbamoyltransferase [Candidatus Omnitrophota bacterium]